MQKVTLIGRLGKDAAIRETQEGRKVISFTIAVNSRVRGTEKTSWYDVASFNYDRYRNMVKYFTKGSSLIVTGDFDADIEEGNDGVTRCRRYVTADSIEFLSNGSGTTRETRTEEEERPRRRSQKEVAPEDISDEELEMSSKPKRKAAEEDEDEAPVRKPKKKAEPEDEEEEEAPARKPKKKAEPADEDDEPVVEKKPKKKAAPEDEDEEELPF